MDPTLQLGVIKQNVKKIGMYSGCGTIGEPTNPKRVLKEADMCLTPKITQTFH